MATIQGRRERRQPRRRHRRLGAAHRSSDEDLLMQPSASRHRAAMKAFTKGAVLAAGASFGLLAAIPGSAALTLTEALVAAYNNNPTLLAQRARLRESDEGVSQALSGWRPTVQFTGSAGFQSSSTTGFATSTLHPRELDLNVTQPVYNGGRTVAATSQAENTVRSTRAQTLATEQTVLFSVVSAYMDVVQNQAVLDLSINNEQVLSRQLEATQDQFRVGEVTRTDVAQAEARLEQAHAGRTQAEGNLASSRATYERVVGQVAPTRVAAARLPPELPRSADEVRALVLNNPDVT